MAIRYRKSAKLAPGIKINFSKNSASVTVGGKGVHHTISSTGKRTTTVGIPGSGLSYSTSTNGYNAPSKANGSKYRINIDLEKTHAGISIGRSGDIFGEIIGISPNNKYYVICDIYRKNDDDDGTEQLVLFTDQEIIYQKKFEEISIDICRVRNDGTVLLYAYEDFIIFDPTGKQKLKRHIGIYYDSHYCNITDDNAYFFGDNDDGDTYLHYYNLESLESWKKKLNDVKSINDDGDEDYLCASDIRMFKTSKCIILLYEDNETYLAYDFSGYEIELSNNELEALSSYEILVDEPHLDSNAFPNIAQEPAYHDSNIYEKQKGKLADADQRLMQAKDNLEKSKEDLRQSNADLRQAAHDAKKSVNEPSKGFGIFLIIIGAFLLLVGFALTVSASMIYLIFVFVGVIFLGVGYNKCKKANK